MSAIVPCKSCPWRVGSRAKDIPGFCAEQAVRLGKPGKVMACHMSGEDAPRPCAGWVVQVALPAARASGEGAIPMRMLLMGMRNLNDYRAPAEPLHKTTGAMVRAIVASERGTVGDR